MLLAETVEMMNSEDYKERFRAEYYQLKIRVEGLSNMLKKYRNGTLEFTPSCSYILLKSQLVAMTRYMRLLEERAEIEEISI